MSAHEVCAKVGPALIDASRRVGPPSRPSEPVGLRRQKVPAA